MQYTIIGRVVDEKFDNMEEEIVGYYVVDNNGNRNFGAVRKIYQLYKDGKLKGVKSFNTNSGEVDFINTDNNLLPKYSSLLFNNFGNNSSVVCSVIEDNGQYKLRYGNGAIQPCTKTEIETGVRSGTIKLNNATISKGVLNINKAMSILEVITKNGNQVSYKVALPDGSIKELSKADVIEKLIKEQGLQLFNAKLDGNGNIIAKSGTLPTKVLEDIEKVDISYTDTFYLLFNNEVKAITAKGKYRGILKNGKPHGKGTFTSQDYGIAFNGEYIDGVKQGEATLSWVDEEKHNYKFSGTVVNNYCEGKNCTLSYHYNIKSLSYTYYGEFKKSRPTRGSICYDDGERCNYSFDAEKGYGKLVRTDRSIRDKNYTYVGNFSILGIPGGKGILTRADGLKIECDNWELCSTNKLRSCKITFTNGDIFNGDIYIGYYTGAYTGDATDEDITGSVYTSTYTNGKMSYSNGDVYIGKWIGTLQNGVGTMNYSNGTVYSGMWKDGKPFGKGVYTFIKTVRGKKVKTTEFGIWDGIKKNNKLKMVTLLSQIYKDGGIWGYKVSIDGVEKEMSCVELMTIDKTKYCILNDCFDILFYTWDTLILSKQVLSDDLVSFIPEPLVCILPAAEELGFRSEISDNKIKYRHGKDKYVGNFGIGLYGKINRATDLILPCWFVSEGRCTRAMLRFITAFKVSGFSYDYSDFVTILDAEELCQYMDIKYKKRLSYNFNILDSCTVECKERYANCGNHRGEKQILIDNNKLVSYVSKSVDAIHIEKYQRLYYKAFHDCVIDTCKLRNVDLLDENKDIGEYFKNCHIHTLVIDGEVDVFKGLCDKERQAKYNYTIGNIISDDFCNIQKRLPDNKTVFKLEEPICDDTGILVGYTVRKPDGKIIKLKCDDICKLASNPNVSFEDELCTNCCTVREKRDDGVVLEVNPLALSVYTNTYIRTKGYKDADVFNCVTKHFKYIIVPSNCCDLYTPDVYYDIQSTSNIETIIVPSHYEGDVDIPATSLKYSNITQWSGWHYTFFNEAYKNMILKLNGGIVLNNNGRGLYLADDTVVKDGVFEVPDGVKYITVSPELTRSVKHLILPTIDFSFYEYYENGFCLDIGLCDVGNTSMREEDEYSYFDFSFFDTLESVTFKTIGIMSEFYAFANGMIKYNSKLKIYVSPEDYRQLEKRPPNVYCKA